MTASSEVAATTVDKTGASDADFQAMLERFKGPEFGLCDECLYEHDAPVKVSR